MKLQDTVGIDIEIIKKGLEIIVENPDIVGENWIRPFVTVGPWRTIHTYKGWSVQRHIIADSYIVVAPVNTWRVLCDEATLLDFFEKIIKEYS
ncbi:MAG: hypothetical protein P1P64_09900 [Treponemataceae bacterium]